MTVYLALPLNWTSVLLRLSSLHSLTIILDDYRQNPNTNIHIFLWWIKNFQSWGRQGSSLEQVKIRNLVLSILPVERFGRFFNKGEGAPFL